VKKLLKPLESQREGIVQNLDKVFTEYIRRKFGYACILTGEKRNTVVGCLLDTGTFFNVRWLPDNYFVIARREYAIYQKGDPFKVISWYMNNYGPSVVEQLRNEAYASNKQFSVQELVLMNNFFVQQTQLLPKAKSSNGR